MRASMTSSGPRLGIVVLGLLLGSVGAGAAADVHVGLTVEPEEVTVGQPLVATLTVDHPAERRVVLPAVGKAWGKLSVESMDGPTEAAGPDGLVRQVLVIRLAAFEVGELELPELVVLSGEGDETEEIRTPAHTVKVRSVLPADEEEPELADLKGPASLPLGWRWPLILALVLLAAAAVALYLWRRRRRLAGAQPAAAAPPVPLLAADVEALEALDRLLRGPLLARGAVKEFHVELAEIVKRYLFRRFQIPTLERTTFEVVRETRSAAVERWVPGRVAALLGACDFVKFARQRPPVEACREQVGEARLLVEKTRPSAPAASPQIAGGEG